ncbi:MAG: TonB-dependent receptor [Ignavibacteria bacterium]|nr:TonB-dependent receptor [Ignavibacteria bacterium]
MLKTVFLVSVLLYTFDGFAQKQSYTLSGNVIDENTGETLIGAIISVKQPKGTGTYSNEYGFYSLTLKKGTYDVIVSYIGYISDTLTVELNQNFNADFLLQDGSINTDEITITDSLFNDRIKSPISGIERLDLKEINKLPILFGERDILKTIQLLPGIKGANEGSSGFSVRGGNYDQNLILLDEAPVYNSSHLLGFFSTFNSDAINDAVIYKGTQPSQYGGRISSVVDIKMKEGNSKHYNLSGGIGIISSKLNIEGPIVKDKGSFLIAARRTYADMFLKLSSDEKMQDRKLYFYDINAKLNYRLTDKDRVYLSGYFGRDVMGLGSSFGIDWGNVTGTLRWNHIFSSKLFSNTSLIYSNYDYNIDIENNDNNFNVISSITDLNFKQEFQFYPNPNHSFRFGFNAIYHIVEPGIVESDDSSNTRFTDLQKRYSIDNSVWLADEWKAAKWLNISAGVRVNAFSILAKGDFYTLDENNNIIDTVSYDGGILKTYINPEPRFSASIILNDNSSVKASYNRNVQNFHLITNSTSTNPTDKWLSSTNNIKPEIGDQISLGFFKNTDGYEFSIEGYYKKIQNVVDYKDNANVTNTDAIETQLLFGDGRSYGAEFFLKKNTGKLTGWISYMLSRTDQKIRGVNSNSWYPSKQDRTHDISIVAMYDVSQKLNLSATWVYHSGNAVTFPSGKYTLNNEVIYYYTERNGYRMPAYHRLDIGGTLKLGSGKKFSSELSFGCYNVYGQKNAYTISFRESETAPNTTEAVKTYLFTWVPYVTWHFNFK